MPISARSDTRSDSQSLPAAMLTHGSHRHADLAVRLTGRDVTSVVRPESNVATTTEQWMAVMGIAPNSKSSGCRKETAPAAYSGDLPPSGKKRRRNQPSPIKRMRHEGSKVEPEMAKSTLGRAAFEQARDLLIKQQQEYSNQTLELHRICNAQRQLADRMTSEGRSPSQDSATTRTVPFLPMIGTNYSDRMHGSGNIGGEAISSFKDSLVMAAISNARMNKTFDPDHILNGAGRPLTVQDVISAQRGPVADGQVVGDGRDVSALIVPTKYEDVVLHQQRLLEQFQKQLAQGPSAEVPSTLHEERGFRPIPASFQPGIAPPWSTMPLQGPASGFIHNASATDALMPSSIPRPPLSQGDLLNCTSASLEECLEKHRAHMTQILDGMSHGPTLPSSTDSAGECHRDPPGRSRNSRETAIVFLAASSGTPPWPSPSPSPSPTGQVVKPKAMKAHGRST